MYREGLLDALSLLLHRSAARPSLRSAAITARVEEGELREEEEEEEEEVSVSPTACPPATCALLLLAALSMEPGKGFADDTKWVARVVF